MPSCGCVVHVEAPVTPLRPTLSAPTVDHFPKPEPNGETHDADRQSENLRRARRRTAEGRADLSHRRCPGRVLRQAVPGDDGGYYRTREVITADIIRTRSHAQSPGHE